MFLASYHNGVDKKGRVSVPAPFRHEMAAHARQQVVVYAAPETEKATEGFLYGWAYDDFLQLAAKIQQLPALSPVRQRLARSILAAARPLGFDDNGRILLPENLLQRAGITEQALFAGEGEYFTIWEPGRFEAYMQRTSGSFAEDLASIQDLWK